MMFMTELKSQSNCSVNSVKTGLPNTALADAVAPCYDSLSTLPNFTCY